MAELSFRRDLYRGTAEDYDRYRVPYPQELTTHLAERRAATARRRLLDLACGTGQIAFALSTRFDEVWAVDQEPDMVDMVRKKAAAAGIANIRPVICAAETLSAPDESFDLIAIGNAFHRLPRETVAAAALRWLRPGRFLALLWGGSPWDNEAPWQQAMKQTVDRWMTRMHADDRIPSGYEQTRHSRPDLDVLKDAGFDFAGSYTFPITFDWTLHTLTGFVLSTSVLSRQVLRDRLPEFEEDLANAVRPWESDGRLRQVIRFTYELARRP
ncbi:MAG TPA: class I SAM-dependent methyltransferase [Micromonosporaceae bacterium]